MCESFTDGIEHPNQDTWLAGYSIELTVQQQASIAGRYADVQPGVVNIPEVFEKITSATTINHAHRGAHEGANRGSLGLGAQGEEGRSGQLRAEYDSFTGRADKVSSFILWFSKVSHQVFVAQDLLPPAKPLEHVSLELGGIRQFGDWETTKTLDSMARSIPAGVLSKNNTVSMTVYGLPKDESERIDDERVTYVEEVPKTYSLLPVFHQPARLHMGPGKIDFDYTMVRRRRPVADIYIPGQSDVAIFKESVGLLVMSMVAPGVRREIIADCQRVFDEAAAARKKGSIKLDDTPGAILAGGLFEDAIDSHIGVTKNIHPISAHYVQGTGKKFAHYRNTAT